MENLKQQLKKGKCIHFDNQEWCEINQSDDVRSGTIWLAECFGEKRFSTWFNGMCTHSSKTWKACENNMNRLFREWNCKITEINDELE